MRATIPAPLAGERIDRVVSTLTGLSRSAASDLVAAGSVRLGGITVVSRSIRVGEGDDVEIAVPDSPTVPALVAEPSVADLFVVVYEDEDIVVADKPAGLVVHPGAGRRTGTLVHGLLARYPDLAGVGDPDRPGVVHRLDKDTSGLLMVARTEEARVGLVDQLARRAVTRRYVVLVWGSFDAPRGMVDAPIARSGRQPTKMAVSARGREARTRYEVVRVWDDPAVTLVSCTLETGRTHQIRVHLAAIGHPVVGDRRYGGDRESFPIGRFFLHAAHLAFTHPTTGRPLAFDSPLPPDLEAALTTLPRQ
ncbi:MAG: RluA family pseudouridine synthase [Acidimicrobiales bacterium]